MPDSRGGSTNSHSQKLREAIFSSVALIDALSDSILSPRFYNEKEIVGTMYFPIENLSASSADDKAKSIV
jgi:hypothetical protein